MDDLDQSPPVTDSHRFFAVASDEIYEHVRAGLDEAWDHPRNGTLTCLWPAAVARKDAQGRPLVNLWNDQAAWPEVADTLADMIGAGFVEEVDRAAWDAAAPVVEQEEGI
jgi:hypothetical protein